MNQSHQDAPPAHASAPVTQQPGASHSALKPVPLTGSVQSCDLPYERYRGPQAYAITFIVGDSSWLDDPRGDPLLNSDVLFVKAHSREEAIQLGRQALTGRAYPDSEYTVVGVYYIDQLLWFAQGAYRTLAGISVPTDSSNAFDPPHEYFKPYGEQSK